VFCDEIIDETIVLDGINIERLHLNVTFHFRLHKVRVLTAILIIKNVQLQVKAARRIYKTGGNCTFA
jgi:hypothetical protein